MTMSTQNRVLNVGSTFPDFKKISAVSIEKGKEFEEVSLEKIQEEGKWMVMFWWPKDFTFVCPTEIAEFNKHYLDFINRRIDR
jgi:peroxiredoxin (alkyl hydroperoxide reductase subunit C)